MTTRSALPGRETDTTQSALAFAWLEVTGFCNLKCTHCYAGSSPQGTHGTMTAADWKNCIDQLAAMGTQNVQFIGGEPTLYPHLADLIGHAARAGVMVEVFSNLTHVSDELWAAFAEYRVRLATSYYSDTAEEHDAVTVRPGSHRRTRANIRRAQELGLRLRGAVISALPDQRAEDAFRDLTDLGLTAVGGDHTRAIGRASKGARPTVADLCGQCAQGKLAIGPDGDVWPCVIGRFISMGNVLTSPLKDIWAGSATRRARAEIEAVHRPQPAQSCTPPQCLPWCGPCSPCAPDAEATIEVSGQIGS
ncbi:radical SAM protein [Streptomyces sp. NPDC058280]|uniref:radical SAM protein n=1 Tax=Streptomyces sp. NPDC058280 TaxID=3346419 RepID=UPI0036EF9AA6